MASCPSPTRTRPRSPRCSGPSDWSCSSSSNDPWRVVLSTDHPNGGSFLSYPALIQLLMDRAVRDERSKQVNPSCWPDQRAGRWACPGVHPQRDRDHHPCRTGAAPGPQAQGAPRRGADADVTVYCRRLRYRADVRDATLRAQGGSARSSKKGSSARAPAGRRLRVRPGYDDARAAGHPRAISRRIPRCRSTTIRCRGCR